MRSVSPLTLLGVFAITTLIFLSGFMFANFLTESKLGGLDQAISDISLQTASVETEYSLMLENPCTFGGFSRLTASLDALAEKLLFNNMKSQQTQTHFMSIKQNYFLLETRHWIFVQKLNKECKTNYTTILYFYSDLGDCANCEAQGIVLSEVKKTYPSAMIYSYDINTDYSLVTTIKAIYNVTTAPSLVINGKIYDKFMTQDDIENVLGKVSTKAINQNQTVACNSSNSTVA
jgi:hypothetical protein